MEIPRSLGLALLLLPIGARAAEAPEDPPRPEVFLSTSAFVVANLLPDPPRFYQLDAGYRVTPRDTLIVEAITWTYDAPLGIPWGPSKEDPAHDYPGTVRDVGVGVAYQRFWWRGLYTTAHATPFLQTYHDEGGARLQTGFQLFVTARLGWHVSLGRVFVEPSIACTAWPLHTNLPSAFAAQEAGWPRYFLGEPGLHVGVHL